MKISLLPPQPPGEEILSPKKSEGGKDGSIFSTPVRAPCCQIKGLAYSALCFLPKSKRFGNCFFACSSGLVAELQLPCSSGK